MHRKGKQCVDYDSIHNLRWHQEYMIGVYVFPAPYDPILETHVSGICVTSIICRRRDYHGHFDIRIHHYHKRSL